MDVKPFGKETLKHAFSQARKDGHRFVFVRLQTPAGKELIVIPKESFDAKEKFYLAAYDENLYHVMNKEVYISGVAFGDSTELDKLI